MLIFFWTNKKEKSPNDALYSIYVNPVTIVYVDIQRLFSVLQFQFQFQIVQFQGQAHICM